MKKKKSPNQKAFQIVTKKEPATPPVQTSEELATNNGLPAGTGGEQVEDA